MNQSFPQACGTAIVAEKKRAVVILSESFRTIALKDSFTLITRGVGVTYRRLNPGARRLFETMTDAEPAPVSVVQLQVYVRNSNQVIASTSFQSPLMIIDIGLSVKKRVLFFGRLFPLIYQLCQPDAHEVQDYHRCCYDGTVDRVGSGSDDSSNYE